MAEAGFLYEKLFITLQMNKDTGIIEFARDITEDVFILYNTKDTEITSADYLPEIEQFTINCPRCRKLIEHAQKLLQKVQTINRNDVKGICEHCRTNDVPCFECEEVAKKFVATKSDRTEKTKELVKQRLSKIKHLLKDAVVDATETGNKRVRAHSDLHIDQLCRESPNPGREPKVKQMFHSETHKLDFDGPFPTSEEKINKMFTQHEKLERPLVFLDSPGKVGKSSATKAKERIHVADRENVDLFDTDIEDLGAMLFTPLTEKSKQKKEIRVELRDGIPPVPFQSEEDFITGRDESTTKFHQTLKSIRKSRCALDEEPDTKRFVKTGKETLKSELPQRVDKFDIRTIPADIASEHKHVEEVASKIDVKIHLDYKFPGSSKATKELLGKTVESSGIIRKYHSEKVLLTTNAGVTEQVIKQNFSYVFPKMLPDKEKIKRPKSSSELIKDIQDMLTAKDKEKKEKLEGERKKKFEEDERRRNAPGETKTQLEAKKKADEEIQRLEASENKTKERQKNAGIRSNTEKKYTTKNEEKSKKDKDTPTASSATSKSKLKDSRPAPEKKEPKQPKLPIEPLAPKEPKASKEPKEPKEPKALKEPKAPKEPMAPKVPKAPNVDKDALKAVKDAENAKKEQDKKEKENRLKQEKEEKERLKKDKEEELRREKEIKQKEKRVEDEVALEKIKYDKENSKENSSKQSDQTVKEAKQKEKEIAEKKAKDTGLVAKPKLEKPKTAIKEEEPAIKELNFKSIKVRDPSNNDFILQLVKLKQSKTGERKKPARLSDMMLNSKDVENHRFYHKFMKHGTCLMCKDSDVELDALSFVDNDHEIDDVKMADIIIGSKICKCKPLIDKQDDQGVVPLVFQSTLDDANAPGILKKVATASKVNKETHVLVTEKKKEAQRKYSEQEVPKGTVRYALSDRSFIDKGWTMLPIEKVVRKMNVYRMRPAHPEFDWFEHNKNKRQMQYDSGETLAEFDEKGRGRLFYRNGRMALDYYNAEELNAQQRFVIYSSGEPDERGRAQPYTLLATFDYLGNGIVFDHSGKIRLKYNQTEGVVLDRSIGPVSHWKWHTLNDPPVLQQVMIDTQMAHKDPTIMKLGPAREDKTRPDNEDMLAIEFDNFIKEKSKKLTQSFKPFQIKMKALKINEQFSLKVLDQATVHLIFRDGTTNLRLNIGMVLDHKEIVDTDTAEVGEVSSNIERLPARTDSIAELQKSIVHAQHCDRSRTERERRLRPTIPRGSADELTAAASRPFRPPLRTGPPGSKTTADCYCKCSRKPIASNVYYDTCLC